MCCRRRRPNPRHTPAPHANPAPPASQPVAPPPPPPLPSRDGAGPAGLPGGCGAPRPSHARPGSAPRATGSGRGTCPLPRGRCPAPARQPAEGSEPAPRPGRGPLTPSSRTGAAPGAEGALRGRGPGCGAPRGRTDSERAPGEKAPSRSRRRAGRWEPGGRGWGGGSPSAPRAFRPVTRGQGRRACHASRTQSSGKGHRPQPRPLWPRPPAARGGACRSSGYKNEGEAPPGPAGGSPHPLSGCAGTSPQTPPRLGAALPKGCLGTGDRCPQPSPSYVPHWEEAPP